MTSKYEDLDTSSVWEQELIAHIGIDAVIALENAIGGQYLYIRNKAPDERLINAIGEQATLILYDAFNGEEIYIPTVLARKVRNANIQKQHRAGLSIKDIAKQTRLSAKWVEKIIKDKYGYVRK